jgi:hypothetical protein
VEMANIANWEYERWGLSRKGSVPNVKPSGIPCNLGSARVAGRSQLAYRSAILAQDIKR